MDLKLDMAKAYDWVEWDFLEAMMRQIRFNEHWIFLILTSIKTVSYFVLINGKPSRTIIPSRGLQQGDPISSYLFLLCMEGLSTLLTKVELDGQIYGIRVARGNQLLNHLSFAEDSILFVERF